MIKYEYFRIAIRIFIVLWILTSLVAIAGMYRLWWQREKKLYLGKDIIQQRIAVFKRAGLPAEILKTIEKINQNWPLEVRYEASGDQNIMSYVSYLLIPRIPSRKSDFKIVVKDNEVQYEGPKSTRGLIYRFQNTPSFRGLLLSVFFVTGVAIFVRRSLQTAVLSWPESIGLSLLLLMVLALLSIIFLKSANTGFCIVSCAGFVGWGYAVLSYIKRRDNTTIGIFGKSGFQLLCSSFHNLNLKRVFCF